MAIAINGSGTVTGISVGGLPDGIVDAGTLATNSVDSAELIDGAVDDSHMAAMAASKLTGALPAISGASLTGITGNTYMWDTTKNLADSSATTITLSGAGFTPKLVIGWANIGNTDVTAFGMQASTPVAKKSFSNVVTGSYTNHYAEFIRLIPVAANDADFNVTTWGADGITITYDKHNSPTGTARLVIAAFG